MAEFKKTESKNTEQELRLYVVTSGTVQREKKQYREGSRIRLPKVIAKRLIDLKVITPFSDELHGKANV
jgi:hypothetical protein